MGSIETYLENKTINDDNVKVIMEATQKLPALIKAMRELEVEVKKGEITSKKIRGSGEKGFLD